MQQKQSATKSEHSSTNIDRRESGAGSASPTSSRGPFRASLLHMLGLLLFDALALYITWGLVANNRSTAAVAVFIISAVINFIFISDRMYPVRWLTPGLVLLILMVLYPLLYTFYIAFTNYSDGHLLSKEQVINQVTGRFYQPENASTYQMTVYRSAAGQFLLLLKDQAGSYFTATEADGLNPFTVSGDVPQAIGDYQIVPGLATFQYLNQLERISISSGDLQIRVTRPDQAQQAIRQYVYDPQADTITDRRTNIVYRPENGNFVDENGVPMQGVPGFTSVVGLNNFQRVLSDPLIRGPFFQVFLWTLFFALATVLLNFSLGLLFAMVMNDKKLPLRGIFRTLLILPYAIPGFISILVWVGLLNPNYGPFNLMIKDLIGVSPEWFSNGTLTKVAILGINLWLGFPYMMLINLGALQSIPTDMYEAADLDGAGAWSMFRYLTLPLLLISVGPLLIGAFAFNFNNFTIIDLVNEGGPPIPGTSTPAGQSDILISYTFRLAFAAGYGADYGLASTIAILIFLIVATITMVNFRFTRQLEEVMR